MQHLWHFELLKRNRRWPVWLVVGLVFFGLAWWFWRAAHQAIPLR